MTPAGGWLQLAGSAVKGQVIIKGHSLEGSQPVNLLGLAVSESLLKVPVAPHNTAVREATE